MQEVKIIAEFDDNYKDYCNCFSILALYSFLILIIMFVLCLYFLYFMPISFFGFLKENNHIDLAKFTLRL